MTEIIEPTDLKRFLHDLTGEPLPFPEKLDMLGLKLGPGDAALGGSQLNELLLLAGLDRVSPAFFSYLLHGDPSVDSHNGFESQEDLKRGIDNFRKLALLLYGNVKFAFKMLSRDDDLLSQYLKSMEPVDDRVFKSRRPPTLPIKNIDPSDAFLTGYIVERRIADTLEEHPEDTEALALKARRDQILATSISNQEAYYASDFLDVYVATSMREKQDFLAIRSLVAQIFGDPAVKDLKLRWFDPTQAYCISRIDKGLAEALMLKRAACTIYLAQETDTLGKDSELASTLAQGKPVIAYVPQVDSAFLREHFALLREVEPDKTEVEVLLDQLRVFAPGLAWTSSQVREWCEAPESADVKTLRTVVSNSIRDHYDSRAKTLRDHHPLGIQVTLTSGVACGVLVARTSADCARLVRAVLTRTLEFELAVEADDTVLREAITGCIFRVATGDAMLTNTFWNFYLQ